MELLGHGIDIVSLSHLQLLLKGGVQIPSDWLTEGEMALAPEEESGKVGFYGGRIAAKEAVVKALGTGFAGDVTWGDVEVLREDGGAPVICLHGALQTLASERGVTSWVISISHTEEQAVASAIALGPAPAD